MITFYGLDSEEGYRQFQCRATTTRFYRNADHYLVSKDEVELIEDESMDAMYRRMARFKANEEVPRNDFGERTEVTFGDIYEILSSEEYDEEWLTATPEWQQHIAVQTAKQQEADAAKAAAAARLAASQESDERKLYERLKGKFG